MHEPTTQLDERFSDPDTRATTWDAAREALESAQLSWISTVRADGRPHVTPLVAVWLDGALHFTTGPTEQKSRNLEANPHVVLTTGCNRWDEGLDVMVEGEARRVTDPATLARLADAWKAKWDAAGSSTSPKAASTTKPAASPMSSLSPPPRSSPSARTPSRTRAISPADSAW